jgi:hypothetical protein
MSRTDEPEGVTMKQRILKRIAAATAVAVMAVGTAVIPASSASAMDTTWPAAENPQSLQE